ncbi:exosome component 10 [Anopheles darlingi]|uniref:Exosome complex component 10 homolog n=1 Tax=Anopheles darlingi TaxID=43151 RepID=W5JI40_ANODA|nr:exosome component 10 [Anopheles darlingi]
MTDKTQKKSATVVDLTEGDDATVCSEMRSPTTMSNGSTVQEYCEAGQKVLMEGMQACNAMPSGKSRDLYSSHSKFIEIMDSHADNVLGIISGILQMQGIKGHIELRDPEEQLEMLQEFNDNMLERIHSNLDEMAGVKKKVPTVLVEHEVQIAPEPRYRLSGAWNQQNSSSSTSSPLKATLITGTNIARPQVNFKTPIDNSIVNPFVPRIRDKPNSLKPLAVLPEYDDAGNIVSYLHPYEFELDRFQPAKDVFVPVTPQEPLPLDTTELVFIDHESQLSALLSDLKAAPQIAIDLEHHSYRTFQGFTCLMQLSTRKKDYIVDTLALRDELHVLNEVFTDPRKLKVLHGAISDIEWLQRDLGLYLVNMFDTGEAARVLQFSRIGLQFLLKHYCNIETDKAYQLADWRMRPLPPAFIEYARKDTHYLLYIYDRIRNDLLEKGGDSLLQTVYDKSTFLCKQRYQKPIVNEDSIMNIYRRSRYVFDHRQMYALREILYWRDKIARQEDESPGYVLPQHMALDIASKLPREMQGILACCTPVPSLVRQNLHALHQIMQKARELPAVATSQSVTIEQRADNRYKMQTMYDISNPLICPHDDAGYQAHGTEGANLPTLLGDLASSFNRYASVGGAPATVHLMKRTPDMAVLEAAKIRPLTSNGHIGLSKNDIGEERYTKLIALRYNKTPMNAQPIKLELDESLSYEQKRFNTPYERYLETCRLRRLKELKEQEENRKRFPLAASKLPVQQVAVVESGHSEIDTQSNEPEAAAAASPPKEAAIPSKLARKMRKLAAAKERAKMTQKQLKRREDTKERQAAAKAEKYCFNGTTQMTPEPKQKMPRTSFPLAIDVSSGGNNGSEGVVVVKEEAAAPSQPPRMEPFQDPLKVPKNDHDDEEIWGRKKPKNKKARQRMRQEAWAAKQGIMVPSSSGVGTSQSSNKPVPIDYSNVDYTRFKGGSIPLAPARKGKRGFAGGFSLNVMQPDGTASIAEVPRNLHPNSRMAKGIKRTQNLFNMSSTNPKRK